MEERMLSAADVMRRLKVSRSYAYKLISRLNEEMAAPATSPSRAR